MLQVQDGFKYFSFLVYNCLGYFIFVFNNKNKKPVKILKVMPTIIDMSLKKVEQNDWQFIQVMSHIVWCEQTSI